MKRNRSSRRSRKSWGQKCPRTVVVGIRPVCPRDESCDPFSCRPSKDRTRDDVPCARHDTLSTHRSHCETIVRERQESLHGTICGDQGCNLSHSTLSDYLYRDLSASYPVLSTATHLIDACTGRERPVRDHLTRRV
ncbi:DUF7260 family protein [Halostagnicola bangensis]